MYHRMPRPSRQIWERKFRMKRLCKKQTSNLFRVTKRIDITKRMRSNRGVSELVISYEGLPAVHYWETGLNFPLLTS